MTVLSAAMSAGCLAALYVTSRILAAALVLEHRAGLARLERAGLR